MRQCGLDIPGVDQIPFGVRAIKSGVEVEGIWISRPNTPELSQNAPSTVDLSRTEPSNESQPRATGGSVQVEPSSCHVETDSRLQHFDVSSTMAHAHSSATAKSPKLPLTGDSSLYESDPTSSVYSPAPNSPVRAITSSPDANDESTCTWSAADDETTHIDTATAVRFSSLWNIHSPTQYGSAEIYANRQTRRPNANFEVLPAGSLGARMELEDDTDMSALADSEVAPKRPERNKLRKSGPSTKQTLD